MKRVNDISEDNTSAQQAMLWRIARSKKVCNVVSCGELLPYTRFNEQELTLLRRSLNELVTSSSVLKEFGSIWSRIGLNSSQRQVRRETITVHVSNLLKEILQEEEELEKSMIKSLQENEVELKTLYEALGLPMERVCHY